MTHVMISDGMIDSLRAMLEDCYDCDDTVDTVQVVAVAEALKKVAKDARIVKSDEFPEALTGDDKLWVTSEHKLVIDGTIVVLWTRCAMGCWGQPGRQGTDDLWYVEEDKDFLGDALPSVVGIVLDIFGLEDSVPDVPAPDKADEIYEEASDGEYAVYWRTVGDGGRVVARYEDRDGAEAVCVQRNREFNAKNPSCGSTYYRYSVRNLVDGEWVPIMDGNYYRW